MSVERRILKNGRVAWRVRWREAGRNRVRQFDRKRDADAFDAEVRRRKRLGDLELLDAARESLADFAQDWFVAYARPNLARASWRTMRCFGTSTFCLAWAPTSYDD